MARKRTAAEQAPQPDSHAAPLTDSQAQPQEPPLKVTLKRRFEREGRWKDVEPVRDFMMRECRQKGMSKEEAQAWTYSELDRLYPPLPPQEPIAEATEATDDPPKDSNSEAQQETGNVPQASEAAEQPAPSPADATSRPREGLGQVPADWPELPPNASLAAEIAWVQAERLRIVEERPNGSIVVRLERARSPAPSWSALSWLETSIRSYAKYVEVAAKATSTAQDEQDMVRRERMALDEVRALLDEMT